MISEDIKKESFSKFVNHNGKIIQFIGWILDITEAI